MRGSQEALDFWGGISIKSSSPPQGALRGNTSVFIGVNGIPTKAQVHGNVNRVSIATRLAYLIFAILRGFCPLCRSGDVTVTCDFFNTCRNHVV